MQTQCRILFNRRDSDITEDVVMGELLPGKRIDYIKTFKNLLISLEGEKTLNFIEWDTLFKFFNTFAIVEYPKKFIDYFLTFKNKIIKVYKDALDWYGDINKIFYYRFEKEELIFSNKAKPFELIGSHNQTTIKKILDTLFKIEINLSNSYVYENIIINEEIVTFLEWRYEFEYNNTMFSTNIIYRKQFIDFFLLNKEIIVKNYFNDKNNLFCFCDCTNKNTIDFIQMFNDYISLL